MSFKALFSQFKNLSSSHFKVLSTVEAGMRHHAYVPLEVIEKFSPLPEVEVTRCLGEFHSLRLLRRQSKPYVGYTLTYAGYDFLALNALVKKGIVEAIGDPVGLGKEADVYSALNTRQKRIAVKFHRLGRISFRQTKRVRGYTERGELWIFRSKKAAEREYAILKKVAAVGVAAPTPIAHNRHAVALSLIEGSELRECRWIRRPRALLREILVNLRLAYTKAGIIHADLSEYNILVKPHGGILIIDWPQSVGLGHENADLLLKRDVKNVLTFFRRKFNTNLDLDATLAYVKGEREGLPLRPQP